MLKICLKEADVASDCMLLHYVIIVNYVFNNANHFETEVIFMR